MSDYTPPTLVTPTPGGNPGDGSLSGALTVQTETDVTNTGSTFMKAGKTGANIIQGENTGDLVITPPAGSSNTIRISGGMAFQNSSLYITSKIDIYNSITTLGLGVAPIYGENARTGLTAADASATTLYTTTAAGQLYRLMGRILATAGTSPSATYTIKWTEGGATITKTLTISALDSDSDLSILIQPDNGTAITAQLTAISGTGTTVNVAATVEQMA